MKPVIERFLSKITVTDSGCWEWTSTINRGGYGLFKSDGKMVSIHRFVYDYYHGSICPDLTIDHLCRNRKCCNPVHLEQVTQKENIRRGFGVNGINARKTHCKNGHEFNKENTYKYSRGTRECRECHKASCKEYRLKLKKTPVTLLK